jgi:DNA primase
MRPTIIDAARQRHSLVDVVARTGIDCHRHSSPATVRCPFPTHGHFDRSPSLYLHLDNGLFFCFGCGVMGDVVEWASRSEGVGWREAIDILDSGQPLTNAWTSVAASPNHRSGRMLDNDGPGRLEGPDLARTPASRIFEALEAAWDYYTFKPLHHRGAAYLWGRGIDVGVLEARTGGREVGHTPARSDGLVMALRSRGFTTNELIDAALAVRRRGTPVTDFYRQRVLIPIHDEDGRVCGFVGRNVGDDRWPKYKNPPRTAVYDKSIHLYRPLLPPSDPRGHVVVVEGTLDAMAIAVASVQSGQDNQWCPVTQSGKELSPGQLGYVLALHPNPPIIAFDGDEAGIQANQRLASAAAERGAQAVCVTLPDGHDPTSWLAARGSEGLQAWRRRIPTQLLTNDRPIVGRGEGRGPEIRPSSWPARRAVDSRKDRDRSFSSLDRHDALGFEIGRIRDIGGGLEL